MGVKLWILELGLIFGDFLGLFLPLKLDYWMFLFGGKNPDFLVSSFEVNSPSNFRNWGIFFWIKSPIYPPILGVEESHFFFG